MDTNNIDALYKRYLEKKMSPQELEEFRLLILDTGREDLLGERMERHWNELTEDTMIFLPENKADQLFSGIISQPLPKVRKVRLLSRISIAAAAVGIIAGGISLFFTSHKFKAATELGNQTHGAPGMNSATLTLSNGRAIRLSDAASGELAADAGVVISKSPTGQLIYEIKGNSGHGGINKLSTANGETYQIRLPDGSDVWLNSASNLSYAPDLLSDGKRTVQLEGEAYFSITKDQAHPFIVQSKGQQIEVLGTQFNVNAYADEPVVATTLLKGAVSITTGKQKKRIYPGEQAQLSAGQLSVQKVDVDNIIDWKNGDFALNHVEFKTAMRKIARWYDMEIVYDRGVPDNLESGGWISRQQPLSAVLKSIEASGLVKFRVKGRKIYVMQ
ncbi:FecR family protein [Chitinophaga sancti]|uniref:FecR domain-containing protein n=1 Tax=Chitinophaga sancti TaxID=1004 RepID=A0A1K1SZD9_9BACT|nr:FecR family protein [Chitinophaga sancti]WQD62317.1 FecR domain-containing protein [Chitinophaga sancti]WQG92114.1 FecR domain-containing protein [Chitinophaga sancti]SFW89447.1 FecR family protein [Chitinophaga sancti]